MGVHPYDLDESPRAYTPRELAGLLAYYQSKRDQMTAEG